MRLFEFEAKEVLKRHGLRVPSGVVLTAPDVVSIPCVVKAQVLFGNRARLGGIRVCKSEREATSAMKNVLGSVMKGEKVRSVLVEDLVVFEDEAYAAFLFDTNSRSQVLLFSAQGGTGIEERNSVRKLVIDANLGLSRDVLCSFLGKSQAFSSVLLSLYDVFVKEDCRLLEVNPLVVTKEGVCCLDAHIDLDDFAASRHKDRVFPARSSLGRDLTERELLVRAANDSNYQGTVKYIELDGDIAFLAAGGGGSLTCMDALIEEGGHPANYAEFSGNPSDEKMYVLTRAAITKPGVRGCWIVGAIANFSRVDTMMAGVVRAFEEVRPSFPIVVRRAGPYEKEGLGQLRDAAKKNGWDVEVFGAETPLTQTARVMVKKAYGNSN